MTPELTQALGRLWEQSKVREMETDVFSLDVSGNPRRNGQLFGVNRETYLMWRAQAGNAKTRRMWRRRNIPNRQREADRFHHHLMTRGTHPDNRQIHGITLIGPNDEEIDPNA